MRTRFAVPVARVAIALTVATLCQGCASMMGMRVSTMPQENSSSTRSMLSSFNPLPFQHRSVSDGALLRAPEDRSRAPFWYYK